MEWYKMIYPNIKMLVKYLDEDGNKHTINAVSIVFGCGVCGNECEITDEDGQVIYCDNGALLEISIV
nr:MAG TPA: Putative acetylornithine deacetylase [Caudoviricetes sp.]